MAEPRLIAWLASLPGAEQHGPRVLLTDPAWSRERLAEARRLSDSTPHGSENEIILATGGTGGDLKLSRHTPDTLLAAARAFGDHFSIDKVDTIEVLPSWHVSGLMSRLRSWASGGFSQGVEWRSLSDVKAGEGLVVSLVPTQLQQLLAPGRPAVEWARFAAVLLGGAPAWPELLAEATTRGVPLAPCYGMTETAAMVTALRPSEFAAGRTGVGRPLPHAAVSVSADGCIQISATSVHRGYLGGPEHRGALATTDLGRVDADGFVHLEGRADDVLITGGKKVSVSWLEARLRPLLGGADVSVVGLPDVRWGTRIVACVPAGTVAPGEEVLRELLEPHQIPKAWTEVAPWPRDERGKLDRRRLREAAGLS